MGSAQQTQIVKRLAKQLGFSHCGISKAGFLNEEAPKLERWLREGRHGDMSWMEDHFDKRLDPTKLVPGANSVISLLLNYYPREKQSDLNAPKISKYAYGDDYHFVIKRKLKELLKCMQQEIGDFDGRVFVDSAPVLDKVWAAKSGLGWIGKHTNLINQEMGSFFFVAEIICDLKLEADGPTTDHCGTCTRCLDACPTEAITDAYVVDGSKCISYFTIELKDDLLPNEMKGKFDNWTFGCDICQDVCPWNRFSKPMDDPGLAANQELLDLTKREWHEMTEEVFQRLFRKSAVKRTKFSGLKRNLSFLRE